MSSSVNLVAGKDRQGPVAYGPGLYLKQEPSKQTFAFYVLEENKVYNLIILFLLLAQFVVFKLCYPFPDFFSDSYSYIFAAYSHLNVNIWPIGYSKFLLLFHWFTHSSLALNFFQYFYLELSCLLFYHTLTYFFPTGKNTRLALCLFLFFNPLNLYLANYVSSDDIFIALSLNWLTMLIWMVFRSIRSFIWLQGLVFIIAFTFRYNASYYPILAAMAICMANYKPWLKIAGSVFAPVLMILFILFCRSESQKLLGSKQFPPVLGGWQWGNNALYMREFIDVDSTSFPTKETAELDAIARSYFRNTPPEARYLPGYVANFFIRQPEAPLKQYLIKHYKDSMSTGVGNVIAWGKVAPVFGEYGLFLIKRHPIAFAEHYMLVNTKNYFLPPLEKLEVYNLGMDEMWPIAAIWFDYHSLKVTSISKSLQGYLLLLFPGLFLVLNLYFIGSLLFFWRKRRETVGDSPFNKILLVLVAFYLMNMAFSIFANIIVIRYQVFPMQFCLAFSMIIIDYVQNKTFLKELKDSRAQQPIPA